MPVLILRPEWWEMILAGQKKIEVRGKTTQARGTVLVSVSGAQTIVGSLDIQDVEGPVTPERFEELASLHCAKDWKGARREDALPYATTYLYHIKDARAFVDPIPHPRQSCVGWAPRFSGVLPSHGGTATA